MRKEYVFYTHGRLQRSVTIRHLSCLSGTLSFFQFLDVLTEQTRKVALAYSLRIIKKKRWKLVGIDGSPVGVYTQHNMPYTACMMHVL